MDTTTEKVTPVSATAEKVAKYVGEENIANIRKEKDPETGKEREIVDLTEEGIAKFKEATLDPSLDYIKEFIKISYRNRDALSEQFYETIVKLDEAINKNNAPWFVPFYVGVRNVILALVFVNSNLQIFKDEEEYKLAINEAGKLLRKLVDDFDPENDGTYNTYPVEYTVNKVFTIIKENAGIETDLVEAYANNLQRIEERKAQIKMRAIQLFMMIQKIMDKNKHNPYDKMWNKILLKAYPQKFRLKRPRKISLEETFDLAGELVINQGYDVDKFVEDFNITEDIVKVIKLSEEDLIKAQEDLIKRKVIDEVKPLKELKEQLAQSLGDQENVEKVIEQIINGATEEDLEAVTDEAAEKIFEKVNANLPDDLKGRKKTDKELKKEE